MSNQPKKRTRVVCPDCGRPAICLIEMWRPAAIYFDTTEDGLWDGKNGLLEPGDGPTHIMGECGQCGKKWRLRGVWDIRQLEAEDGQQAQNPA